MSAYIIISHMLNELLVPRGQILYTPLESGRFVPISTEVPDSLKRPMVRSASGEVKGYASGYRSGLIKVDGKLYKLKGCRPEEGEHGKQPMGTALFSTARFEADNTLERRSFFLSEGIEYPLKPVGFWVYDHLKFKGEEVAATIYETAGDTRLDEFLWWMGKMPFEYMSQKVTNEVSTVLKKAAYITGRHLRCFHDGGFSWDSDVNASGSNAHAGNIIIFPKNDGNAGYGLIDFDISYGYHPNNSPEYKKAIQATQIRDKDSFGSYLTRIYPVSLPKPLLSSFPYESGHLVDAVIKRIAPHFTHDEKGEAGGYLLDKLEQGAVGIEFLLENINSAYNFGYNGKNMNRLLRPVSWRRLAYLSDMVIRSRKEFIAKVKNIIGGESPERIQELGSLLYN